MFLISHQAITNIKNSSLGKLCSGRVRMTSKYFEIGLVILRLLSQTFSKHQGSQMSKFICNLGLRLHHILFLGSL